MSDFSFKFQLLYQEERQILEAVLEPAFGAPALTRDDIESAIISSEYAELYRYESNIDELVVYAKDLSEKGRTLHQEYQSKLEQVSEVGEEAAPVSEGSPPEDQAVVERESQGEALSEPDNDGTQEISAQAILDLIGEARLTFDVAERRDARITFTSEEDDLKAYISIEAAYGGAPADEERIRKALATEGITFGVDEEALGKISTLGSCSDLLIASGTKPRKGKASGFQSLVSEQITTGPKIDAQGRANYHDINEFVIVEPNTPLMKRTSPGKGKPGTDVYGRVIPPIPGDILPFSANIYGSRVSDDSHDILIATEKGHPVIEERGVSISNVLMLRNVGLSTGNVDFDGSVCVEGDVADGVKIDAAGDVTVKGVVGKAKINAGGNVVILQGLIGGSKEAKGDEDPYGAYIEAGGSVSAHFVTRAHIRAGKHIVVPEYVSHSDLRAEHQILIGQSSGKGNLFGGKARAFDLVAAKVIGCTGGSPTEIQVGAEGDKIIQLRRISKEKRLNDEQTYDINEALHKISLLARSAGMTPQMKEKVEALSERREKLQEAMNGLKEEEEEIKKVLMRSKKSRVIANHQVFNNSIVSILGSSMKISEESKGGSFRFEARKVVFEA